jgi:hypothetical protein
MAIISSAAWGHVERPWGYEVRVDYVTDDGSIVNEVLTFAMQPSQAEIGVAVEARRLVLTARLIADEEARNIEEALA